MRALVLALTVLHAGPLVAQAVPTGFAVDNLVQLGLTAPNDFCFLPGGRCLVANNSGLVSLYTSASTWTIGIGTIPNVETGAPVIGARGLLSICADPGFATNGYFYVYYSSTSDAFMHLDRFTCLGDLANASTNLSFAAASRHVLLGTLPDVSLDNNGGCCRFGPDGMLYVSVGDDGVACDAQSLTSQAGCVLRLDVSQRPPGGSTVLPPYSALDPGNNPNSAANDFSQLVIAHGLQNPFRMEIDPLTGNLYIGDYGPSGINQHTEYSEYAYPAAGSLPLVNFGWPWRQGNQPYVGCSGTQPPNLVDPIVSLPSGSPGWGFPIGGPRYRNMGGQYDFGALYEGCAFFVEHNGGELRRFVDTGTWGPAPLVPGQPSATNWGQYFPWRTSLQLGPDGAIWFTGHPGGLGRFRGLGPQSSIVAVNGGGQRAPAGEAFPQPLVARVFDPQGNPLPGGSANFAITGPGVLSTTNPVIADANGFAQTAVTATAIGGSITVTGTTTVGMPFARSIHVSAPTPSLLVLWTTNQTDAVPPNVPYVVMVSFPGSPTLPTILGPLCIDPGYALALVIEDGTGLFNFVSFSGSGGIGTPALTKTYPLPPGILAGQLMRFQAIGFDPITGWFRTNCEQRQS